VNVVVRRDGRLHAFTIYPQVDKGTTRTRIGFGFAESFRPYPLVGAAGQSVSEMWYVTHATLGVIAKVFEPKDRSQLHGIVGISVVTQQAVSIGATAALEVLALISLSLGIINLFPFLPLDGGHVFWALAEKVRGRRIPFQVMERAGAVGFVLILMLFAVGLSNDISSLSGNGFLAH
jgi:regulator of sigma E protease